MKDALLLGLIHEFSELNIFPSHRLIPKKCTGNLTAGVPICIDQLTCPLARENEKNTHTVNFGVNNESLWHWKRCQEGLSRCVHVLLCLSPKTSLDFMENLNWLWEEENVVVYWLCIVLFSLFLYSCIDKLSKKKKKYYPTGQWFLNVTCRFPPESKKAFPLSLTKEHLRPDFSFGKENPFQKGTVVSITAADAAGGRWCAFQASAVSRWTQVPSCSSGSCKPASALHG